ncbi:Nn.00g087160.m01.CDS01 [Neocucurbitaria sp. VM-36]
MQYSILLLSLISITTSALPFSPRAAATQDLAPQLLSTINDLNTAVTSLTTAVNNFDGSLLGLLPQSLAVVGAETKVDVTILKATHIASSSASFTADESTQIVQTLASQIEPIQASLNALKTKYPAFKKTLTSPIVLIDLKVLKKHTDGLIAAVTPKVTADNAGLLGLGQSILDQAFDDAIAVYQG